MFKSFFLAGFECATGYNAHGDWIDQISATEHDVFLREDYARITQAGLRAVREGVRWPLVDQKGRYDFDTLDAVLRAADEHRLDLILDLFHYGYPNDLDPFGQEFVERFADYCYAVAKRVRYLSPRTKYFTPVNEPSYFAWAAGEAAVFAPHERGRAYELKVNLIRAAIQGIDAIHSVIPDARIVNADPLCRVACPNGRCDLEDDVHHFNENIVFESLDMLAGRLNPELGGSKKHLDIVGLNYYWTNQWEHTVVGIPLPEDDERCWPLRDLVRWVWHRYGHEMIISETMHVGDNRERYLREVGHEVEAILAEGIPLRGVCLYPILGMPEWHDQTVWTRMGLWDLHPNAQGALDRIPHEPAMRALREVQSRVERRAAMML